METVRILLINTGFQIIDGAVPALGMCYIASSLRQANHRQYEFKLISTDYEKGIKEYQPHIVGISSVSKNFNVAKECARIAHNSGIPVIIGGIHISAVPHTMTKDMDIAIMGEGDLTIQEVMSAYNKGYFDANTLKAIKGIAYWNNGELIINPARDLVTDLDTIPYPARELIPIERAAHMLTGRGCPFRCVFCSTSRFTHNRLRQASPDYVIGEIEQIYKKYQVNLITIYDDLFAINTSRVYQIQQGLAKRNLLHKLGFALCLRADLVTNELAEILKDMGVMTVGMGLESGCPESLKYLKGNHITVEDNANAIRILNKHHIEAYGSFIVGAPYEDKKQIQETLRFIKVNKLKHFDIGILVPFPGTPVWEYARDRGLVSDEMDWSRLDFRFHQGSVILSEKLSFKELMRINQKIKGMKRRSAIYNIIRDSLKHPKFFLNILFHIEKYKAMIKKRLAI